MPHEALTKKISIENYRRERALKVVRRRRKSIDLPIESWKQAAQERSKWGGLINKGAAHYERESVSPKEIEDNGKPRPIGHQQIP